MNLVSKYFSSFLFSIVLITFLIVGCDTSDSVEPPYDQYFMKQFGGDGDQRGVDMVQSADGSIYILGNWQSSALSGNKLYLIKTDKRGNVIWEMKFGSTAEQAKDMELVDNEYLMILSDLSLNSDNTDIKLVKISLDGLKLDSALFGSSKVEVGKSITPLNDGGFIITGSTTFDTSGIIDPNQPNQFDLFHYRCTSELDFLPEIQWRGQYGPGTVDQGTKVVQYSDNIFYVFGDTNMLHEGNSVSNQNLFYYSMDGTGLNGDINFLGDFDNDTQAQFVIEVPLALGGGFLIAGTEYSPSGSVSLHAVKLRSPLLFNSVNDEQFDKEIAIEARKLTLTAATATRFGGQGYILLADEARETGNNIWLTKIDQSGNQVWSSSFGSEEEDETSSAILELEDGKLLVLGSVRLTNNQYKIVLMKLNSTGHLMN